ncbi:MAG: 2-dehydro-3-deoxy-6-phosphogalactonate aldolase [Nitratireductor sp.]
MTPLVAWPQMRRSMVAILRGIEPAMARDTALELVDAGFTAIEVPLNSPDPFISIEAMAKAVPDDCLIGAGTVLATDSVERLYSSGGKLMVSPNVDGAVIQRAGFRGMVTMPGVFTPTEALCAVSYGASALKFFPASVLGPAGIAAIRAVLPGGLEIGAVGGVGNADFGAYAAMGIRTFGLGSSLYKPGATPAETGQRARKAVAAYDAVFGKAQS